LNFVPDAAAAPGPLVAAEGFAEADPADTAALAWAAALGELADGAEAELPHATSIPARIIPGKSIIRFIANLLGLSISTSSAASTGCVDRLTTYPL
jgi:hypothetical protein